MMTFALICVSAIALWIGGNIIRSSGRAALAQGLQLGAIGIAMFAVHAWHLERKKHACGSIAAAMVILDDQIREGRLLAARSITNRGIVDFAAAGPNVEKSAAALWAYAAEAARSKEPNQPPEPTR